jgi:hypothetical protein
VIARLVVLAVVVTVSSCSAPAVLGAVGLTVDEAGHPVGVAVACDSAIDRLTLFRPGDEGSPLADWRVAAEPHTVRRVRVDFGEPAGGERLYGLEGRVEDDLWWTPPVLFRFSQLAALPPGRVLVGGAGELVTMDELRRRACLP